MATGISRTGLVPLYVSGFPAMLDGELLKNGEKKFCGIQYFKCKEGKETFGHSSCAECYLSTKTFVVDHMENYTDVMCHKAQDEFDVWLGDWLCA